jgi:2-keto-4-pentenoate hydratase
MNKTADHELDASTQEIVERFHKARQSATPLNSFPGGSIPATLEDAYTVQNALIDRWQDTLVGWKVGQIPADLQSGLACDRLAGPIFLQTLRCLPTGKVSMPIFEGGFAAIEAEFVAKIKEDCPRGKVDWTLEEAENLIDSLHIGIEVASSPLQNINGYGPCAVVCGYGNNNGLLVGQAIEDWQSLSLSQLRTSSVIDGEEIGTGGASNLKGGFLRSVQFAAEHAAANGRPLQKGQYIATGQTNGIHEVVPGQSVSCLFDGYGSLSLEIVHSQM